MEWYHTHKEPLDIMECPAFSNPDMVVTNRLLSDGQQHSQEELITAMQADRSVLTMLYHYIIFFFFLRGVSHAPPSDTKSEG